jgi:uncharacterized protein (DUF1697 family)
MVYLVLFRGVGGATQLPTAPLRKALLAAGFRNVATYINSGNAIVTTDLGMNDAAAKIAAIVKRELSFEKDIMLVSRPQWATVIKDNPFPEATTVPTSLHVFVLSAAPKEDAVDALRRRITGTERVVVKGRILYLHVPQGFSKSKLPPVIDQILRVVSTARNWNTVVKLKEMADKGAQSTS